MMASFMSYFGARRDPKQSARDAIVTLRQQLQMIEKKEEYLQKKIDDELKKAKANAVSNKAVATAALKRKKASELELDRLAGTRLQLEMQVNTLESANLNAETMAAMKKASDALKVIHGNLDINKVDATMATVNEQRELANEIAESLANPIYGGMDIDEDELNAEIEALEQDELNERLSGAERAPVHLPAGTRVEGQRQPAAAVEDDEEAQLKELQAALAM
ncbi:ESCRT-III subunit protein snf7 [Asterophora parasitica]|uniref:Vacuolar-sorting protein SNF7 n=1 Tax=Asterophora parasitica TaxID=117018 RepID=A0A9P7GGA7_9AGAR|nr:ESCRT-III subunit protein snf7 [Asterophora parasitica]